MLKGWKRKKIIKKIILMPSIYSVFENNLAIRKIKLMIYTIMM